MTWVKSPGPTQSVICDPHSAGVKWKVETKESPKLWASWPGLCSLATQTRETLPQGQADRDSWRVVLWLPVHTMTHESPSIPMLLINNFSARCVSYFSVAVLKHWLMPNLAGQPEHIWTQGKPKQLDIPVRDYYWSDHLKLKTHPKSGPDLMIATHIKGQEKGKFASLYSLLRASSSLLMRRHSLTGIRTSFGIST